MTQSEKAAAFLALHDRSRILVLPNAWDVASARIFEAAGFHAIGTTSAGVAATLGYADGERVSRQEMIAAVARIAGAVAVPVSADIEGGYGESAAAVAETVRAVLAAGAVGINLEDSSRSRPGSLLDVALQVERIRAAREAAAATGVPLVINARTDIYLIEGATGQLDTAVRRANSYREAGADCLFVVGVRDPDTIATLAREINGPLNIMVLAGVPPVAELARLGVARVSMGAGPMRATMALTRAIAEELLNSGTYDGFLERTMDAAAMRKLLER